MSRSDLEPKQVLNGAMGTIDTPSLYISWVDAPWDTALYGFNVLQINCLEVRGRQASEDMTHFEDVRDRLSAGLVSCRMPHDRLRESMLLESHGFRFIEMVFQPELSALQTQDFSDYMSVNVALASDADLHELENIAGTAFRNERFHVDPRLDASLGDERYRRWVRNSFAHERQSLYAIKDGPDIVAVFVTEMLLDGTCYWHLNAVAPQYQGRGYGRRAWLAMLKQAQADGATAVRTCIAARNHRVLNLYARLGFYFPPPLMTFHWVREAYS